MAWEGVLSSYIDAVDYDESSSTLKVRFKSDGSEWAYLDVPAEKAAALRNAPSVGRYFIAQIRDSYQAEAL